MQDAPEENYRNRFLANAMFQLGLVDTRGGGIKKMYLNQIKRFFPLPDYNFEDGKTRMTLTGKILDPEFGDILSNHPGLSFSDVFLLDRVQKKKEITDEEFKYLKKLKFVEGRRPNVYLSRWIVEPLNDETLKAEYIANRSFDDAHFKEMILEYLKKFGKAKRKSINNLIIPKLSAALPAAQKKNKVTNFLSSLRMEGKIKSTNYATWEIV
jgi:ATP-dependent DNA helicase RecG